MKDKVLKLYEDKWSPYSISLELNISMKQISHYINEESKRKYREGK